MDKLSNSKKSLLRQIKDRENKFFSSIRYLREHNLKISRSNYSWSSYKYKIYPSSLSSFGMCPKKFIEEDVHVAPNFSIDQSYKMEVGTALHRMYQLDALKTTMLWEAPSFTIFEEEHRNILQEKLDANWPEVPIYDAESGISGRADLVLNIDGEPVVFDIKTTSMDKERWKTYKEEKLPHQAHIVQVSLYIYFMNLYKYYTKKITKGALGYVNIAMAPGEENSEKEKYFEYTPEIEMKVDHLVSALSNHREAFLKEKKLDCSYIYCNTHGKENNDREKDIKLV